MPSRVNRGLFSVPRGGAAASVPDVAAFDPATLSLTGWWRDYTVTSWAGTASAGTSGGATRDLESSGGTTPGTGTSLNGHVCADLDGTDDILTQDATVTPDTYFNATSVYGWILLKIDAVSGTDHILETNGSTGPLVIRVTGTTVTLLLNNGAASVSRTIAIGSWQLITFRYDGTNVQIGVNEAPGSAGGGSTAAFSTALSSLTGTALKFGEALGGGLDGKIAEIAFSDTSITDANFNNVRSYMLSRYGVTV